MFDFNQHELNTFLFIFNIYFVPGTNVLVSHEEIDWNERGREELEVALSSWPKWKPAKNLILFIGDGMMVGTQDGAHVTARIIWLL